VFKISLSLVSIYKFRSNGTKKIKTVQKVKHYFGINRMDWARV